MNNNMDAGLTAAMVNSICEIKRLEDLEGIVLNQHDPNYQLYAECYFEKKKELLELKEKEEKERIRKQKELDENLAKSLALSNEDIGRLSSSGKSNNSIRRNVDIVRLLYPGKSNIRNQYFNSNSNSNSNSYQNVEDLLENVVETIPQWEVTKVMSPCTGFCYYVIKNSEEIKKIFLSGNKEEYKNYLIKLIQQAAKRKSNNKNINLEGEHIDQLTIKEDFWNLTVCMEFIQKDIVDSQDLEKAKNEIYMELISMKNYLLVTRSQETFLLIKLEDDKYLAVDSHRRLNGTVNTENAIKYITKFGNYKGNISLGIW